MSLFPTLATALGVVGWFTLNRTEYSSQLVVGVVGLGVAQLVLIVLHSLEQVLLSFVPRNCGVRLVVGSTTLSVAGLVGLGWVLALKAASWQALLLYTVLETLSFALWVGALDRLARALADEALVAGVSSFTSRFVTGTVVSVVLTGFALVSGPGGEGLALLCYLGCSLVSVAFVIVYWRLIRATELAVACRAPVIQDG